MLVMSGWVLSAVMLALLLISPRVTFTVMIPSAGLH
jgi:ABC-type transport system involved in cytochrome bd biosynthesis fused ATPase/permease subunit